jgi:ADP-ribose pyrophosphatase
MENDTGIGRIRPWKVLQSELVLDNAWAKVRRDTCQLPDDGVVPDYYYWEGGDFAQIFALSRNNDVILTRQYKHGVKEVVIELPAGLINDDTETPLAAAQRELREETGYTTEHWMNLGMLNVSSAKASTRAHIFLASQAVKTVEPHVDPTEVIEVLLLNREKLIELVDCLEIRDSNSLAAIFLALKVLSRNGP